MRFIGIVTVFLFFWLKNTPCKPDLEDVCSTVQSIMNSYQEETEYRYEETQDNEEAFFFEDGGDLVIIIPEGQGSAGF